MSELYWFTRLDNIQAIITLLIVLSSISVVVFIVVYAVCKDLSRYNDKHTDFNKDWAERSIRILKTSTITLVISIIASIFIPSTKEAFIIYGVGGTIDYLQSNETVQKLPDKVVNALDAWVDSWSDEEQEE